jgi:hypothetical protein
MVSWMIFSIVIFDLKPKLKIKKKRAMSLELAVVTTSKAFP